MPLVKDVQVPKPIEKYLVIKKMGNSIELLCETSNFNSAASFHLQRSVNEHGIYILKNVEYALTAREVGK